MSNDPKKPDPRTFVSPRSDDATSTHHTLPAWQTLPLGGVVTQAGNAVHYNTGNWTRTTTRWRKETCINCNLCWPVCPHDSIMNDADGNMAGVDEEKCTNCGLCIDACPTKPKSLFMEMKPEKPI